MEATPFLHEKDEIDMTLSVGIVETRTYKNCPRLDDVLSRVDVALYRAKNGGRNQVVVFDE